MLMKSYSLLIAFKVGRKISEKLITLANPENYLTLTGLVSSEKLEIFQNIMALATVKRCNFIQIIPVIQ